MKSWQILCHIFLLQCFHLRGISLLLLFLHDLTLNLLFYIIKLRIFSFFLIFHFDQMVSKLCLDRSNHMSDFCCKCGIFEFFDHLSFSEFAKVSTVCS